MEALAVMMRCTRSVPNEVLTYDILLEQAGFKSFKLYADFEDKEPTETSARWFFVAQK